MQALSVIPPGRDRSQWLGGADIAAVLGISSWTTPLQLWEAKTRPGAGGGGPATGVKRRGVRWEGAVAEMLVEDLESRGHAVEIVMASKSAIKLQCKGLPLSGSDALALAAEIDNRSEAGGLDLGALADPDAVRAVAAGDAEPPALQPPQEPDIDLGAMPMHTGRAEVPAAVVAPAPAPPAAAAFPAAAAPVRPMVPPPRARRGFDADAFAQQLQRAADKGDAETLDALGEQLRDVPGEELRATLTDMHARLRTGLGEPQHASAVPVPTPRRSGAP